ncbi:MAG: prolipoprotein diacylglyceryl transferase [Coprococcus sp.]
METISEFFRYIFFPNLGITLKNIGDHISIFGFEIRFYGIVITLGFVLAYFMVTREAKRTNQNPELYMDFMLVLILPVILGARIYYILFRLDEYIVKGSLKETLVGMINIRNGGLAIYGGIIAGVIVGIIFAKVRKINVWQIADTAVFGLLIGQILGRFGNFFNREAFGGYTDSLFAMAIPLDYYRSEGSLNGLVNDGIISDAMLANTQVINGMECITVHPTFLYESFWNLLVLIFLLIYRKHQKFTGEFALIYVMAYGLGRSIIEGLRTDSLMIGNTGIRVSQLLGIVCFVVAGAALIYNYIKCHKVGKTPQNE